MDDLKPEEHYRAKIDKYLERYFIIDREIKSVCSRYRIDYILQCKESKKLFGLEVKSEKRMRGNDFGKYLKQASNYSSCEWYSQFGKVKVLIFITPAISNSFINITKMEYLNGKEIYYSQHDRNHEHSNVAGLIGQICNIGEIRSFKGYYGNHYFSIMYRNKTLWSSRLKGKIHEVNYNFYNDKL
jgi:hypothetical protein